MFPPLPSSPLPLYPQHSGAPSLRAAQACEPGQNPPRASLVKLGLLKKPVFHLILKSLTVTGSKESCRIPSPKAPFSPGPPASGAAIRENGAGVPGIRRHHRRIIDSSDRHRDERPSICSVTQLTLAVFSPAFYGFVGKHGATVQITYPHRYGGGDIADGDRNI